MSNQTILYISIHEIVFLKWMNRKLYLYTKNEVYQILKQLVNDLKQDIIGNGMRVATLMAKSHYSKESALSVQGLSGPRLYESLNNLVKNFNFTQLNNKLKDIC